MAVTITSINSIIAVATTSVTTAATAIPAAALTFRRSILVTNNGSVAVYLGTSSVTTANGTPLAPAASLSLELSAGVVLYGIVASGTADVRTLEGA